MIKTPNIFQKKPRILTTLASASLLFVVILLVSSHALASTPAKTDYSKNFLYKPPCQTGIKGGFSQADLRVVSGRNDTTPYACIRLIGNNVGYSTSALPPPNNIVSNNACPADGPGGASEVYTVDGGGFGFICVTVTDASKWDKSDYSPSSVSGGGTYNTGAPLANGGTCGAGQNAIKTAIDFGCRGKGNAILDLMFAIIRFLSIGVGIVIIGSIVVAGIQYTASRGDPQATAKALTRVYSTVGALFLFLFSYAILNYLIPAGILK